MAREEEDGWRICNHPSSWVAGCQPRPETDQTLQRDASGRWTGGPDGSRWIRHVVIGAGPLGLAVAREIGRTGERVRLVTRTARGEAPSGLEVVAGGVSDPGQARRAL